MTRLFTTLLAMQIPDAALAHEGPAGHAHPHGIEGAAAAAILLLAGAALLVLRRRK